MTRTRILTRRDVEALLEWDECIAAVEDAFRLHARGRSLSPGVLGVHAPDGGFHIQAAGLELGRLYFAAKTNANFPDNPRRHGLPAIQGVIVLCDAGDGRPLALMDSMEVTLRRTAAATAVAARRQAPARRVQPEGLLDRADAVVPAQQLPHVAAGQEPGAAHAFFLRKNS